MLCTDKHILISRFALYHSSDQVFPHPYPWPVLVVLSSTASPRVFSHSPSSYFCIAQSPFKVIIVIYCTIGVASWQKGFSYPYPLPHKKKTIAENSGRLLLSAECVFLYSWWPCSLPLFDFEQCYDRNQQLAAPGPNPPHRMVPPAALAWGN